MKRDTNGSICSTEGYFEHKGGRTEGHELAQCSGTKPKLCHWQLNEHSLFCCHNWEQNPASASDGQNIICCKCVCQFWACPSSWDRVCTVIPVCRAENKNNLRFLKHQFSYAVSTGVIALQLRQILSFIINGNECEPATCFSTFHSSFLLLIYVKYSRKSKRRGQL